MERIFVQIASYRDPELQSTLTDLFSKAEHPERITAGICLQLFPELDHECEFHVERQHQVRCIRVRANESRGVCWARSLIQKLWEGEEYTLQIDSHMRFEPAWDTKMINVLKICPTAKALLTTYPPEYTPPNVLPDECISIMKPSMFDEWRILRLESVVIPSANAPLEPFSSALSAACFLFGPSNVISEVPYDPHLYFFGEEISLTVRLWTHGWNFFHPHIPLLYHRWDRDYRNTHWKDVPSSDNLDTLSRNRVNHLLGIASADKYTTIDLEKYGLGKVRSLADYEQFSGICFQSSSIERYRFFPNETPTDEEPLEPFSW